MESDDFKEADKVARAYRTKDLEETDDERVRTKKKERFLKELLLRLSAFWIVKSLQMKIKLFLGPRPVPGPFLD
jgi:hypothetical protein